MTDHQGEAEIVARKVPGRAHGWGEAAVVAAAAAKNVGTPASAKPSSAEIKTTSREQVARELSPSELFEKVALEDAEQNARLSTRGRPTGGGGRGRSWPRASAVAASFKKVGDTPRQREADDAAPTTRMRFFICTLGLASLAMSQMSRMVLNQSITQMVDPSMMQGPSKQGEGSVASQDDGSCPWPADQLEEMQRGFTPRPPDSQETAWPSPLPPLAPSATSRPQEATGVAATTLRPPSAQTVRVELEVPEAEDELPDIRSASPRRNNDNDPNAENLNELPDFEEHEEDELVTASQPQETARAGPPEVDTPPTVATFELVTESGGGETAAEVETAPTESTLWAPEPAAPPTPPTQFNGTQPQQRQQAKYPQFAWDMGRQNVLLGGFYYSYFVFMVLGGRMAEIYGAKYVLLLSVGGSALINLATPWMARTSFALLVSSRVLMGAIQAGVFPGMYALIAKWLTMTEASIYAPLIKMNLRLGMVLGSLLPGLVEGWPAVFQLTGALSALWSLLWLAVATSDPADNRWVSRGELKHINRKKGNRAGGREPSPAREEVELGTIAHAPPPSPVPANGTAPVREQVEPSASATKANQAEPKRATPWLQIITAPSVVGLIIVKLTFNYALDFLAIELPSYLKYVHHAKKETISAITGPMFGIQVALIVFVGWLAKVTVQRRPLGWDKTQIRKLFQGVASFGLAASFLALTFNNCNLLFVTVLLQIISFLSMFTAGGETMLPYDLSLEYPATIMAIANSVANLSGVTTTTLAGLVLGSQGGSQHRWNILLYLIAGANLVGGLAFTLLVRAEPIDFGDNEAGKPKRDASKKLPAASVALEVPPVAPAAASKPPALALPTNGATKVAGKGAEVPETKMKDDDEQHKTNGAQ